MRDVHIFSEMHISSYLWPVINLGCAVTDKRFIDLPLLGKYCLESNNGGGPFLSRHLPIGHTNGGYEIGLVPEKISLFNDKVELTCRCASFGLLTLEIFQAIAKEIKISDEELFRKLPPYLQKSERTVEIRQKITKDQAASHTGITDLKAAAKSSNSQIVLE